MQVQVLTHLDPKDSGRSSNFAVAVAPAAATVAVCGLVFALGGVVDHPEILGRLVVGTWAAWPTTVAAV